MKDQEVFEALLSNARSVTLPGRITYFLIYTKNSKVGIRRQKTNSPLLLDNVFILEYFYIFHVIIYFVCGTLEEWYHQYRSTIETNDERYLYLWEEEKQKKVW